MHERTWLHGTDLDGMISLLGRNPDQRKARLAACAYFRRMPELLADRQLRAAIEAAEDFADYRLNREKFKVVCAGVREYAVTLRDQAQDRIIADKNAVPDWAASDPDSALWHMFGGIDNLPAIRRTELVERLLSLPRFPLVILPQLIWPAIQLSSTEVRSYENEHRAARDLLRDTFGNPFRPVTFSDEWRTHTAVLLAREIYTSRDFSAMPILADALQDLGCDNSAILSHCREEGATHVRGCWVVDLVLGKE